MKKIALALAGASVALTGLMATPAAAADFRGHDRGSYTQVQNRSFGNRDFAQNRSFSNRDYAQNRTFEQNRFNNYDRFNSYSRFQGGNWHRGERFDSRYATNYMMISDPGYYGLNAAPYGYRWVRSGNNAVLVAIASGIIGALVANAF